MERSPGVFFKDKIWLVGGSQIDPTVCSNKVWWFDPTSKAREVVKTAGGAEMWTARMGHACTTFDNKIWILGGVDQQGNTLSDVWYSSDGQKWQKGEPLTTPLCLATAFDFERRLWVYGGADAPFGTPQSAVWYRTGADKTPWQQMKFYSLVQKEPVTNPGPGDPFGSALCIDSTTRPPTLCGVGTFQTASGIASGMFTVSGENYVNNTADVHRGDPIPSAKAWPTTTGARLQQVFRLSAVSFQSRIFIVSLIYRDDGGALSYLVR
jgi:hypothetical protein